MKNLNLHLLKKILFITLLAISFTTQGQLTGQVTYQEYGIAFDIPQNWVGQELEDLFVMGSSKEAGIVVMIFHPAKDLVELKKNMGKGINEGGITLKPSGAITVLNNLKIEALYEGIVNNEKAKGISIGMINPSGSGVVLFALVNPKLYSKRILEIGRQIGNSFKFSNPMANTNTTSGGLTVQQVSQDLGGNKLTYLDSYYSNTSGGGGYQREKEINLCPNGLFTFFGGSYLNFPDPNYDPYQKNTKGHGTWEFLEDSGKIYLQLNYNDGEYESFHVTYKDGKTHLNGGRYYISDVDCH